MPSKQNSQFHDLWSLGYTRLVPIIPPDAELSENSALYKKLQQGKDARGKAVGIRGSSGKWFGFDWLKSESSLSDLDAWSQMSAGVGIRTGNGLIALDIDTLDEEFSAIARRLAAKHFQTTAVRAGRWPKCLLPYRTDTDVPYQRVDFTGYNGKQERIELLTRDRQFVAYGTHPVTGRPYDWKAPLPRFETLPLITQDQIDAYFKELASLLPKAEQGSGSVSNVDRSHVDQSSLVGDLEKVTAAVRALPNTQALFPTYDDYIRVGAAIKGATQEFPQLGIDLFIEWAEKYEDNDAESAAADYHRIKPPFELGARWLFDKAAEYGHFQPETVWFDVIPDEQRNTDAALFDLPPASQQEQQPFRLLAPLEWEGHEPAPREWEVEGWIPRGEVTLLYGDGGIGKTLIAQQYATSAAAGIPWLGQPTRQAKVLCYLCEDSEDELHRRQKDINAALCLNLNDVNNNLRYAPRKFMDNVLASFDRNSGLMKLSTTFHQLRQAALDFGAKVIIVDTIADVFAGSEIDRVQVNAFVKTCLGKLAQDINGTVIALGHPSMAGKSSGSGTSGSTAWNNAVRSRLYLDYPKGVDKGDVRELKGMKSNYGPRGNLLKLRWNRGAFDVIASSVAASSSGDTSRLDNGNVPAPEQLINTAVKQAVANCEGVEFSFSARSDVYYAKVLYHRNFELFEMDTVEEVEKAVKHLLATGDLIKDGNRITLKAISVLD